MIEDAREKKFDAILTKDLSRLTRNKELSNQIFNVTISNKIQIITMDGVCLNDKKIDKLIDDYYHHSKVTATSHDERNVLA